MAIGDMVRYMFRFTLPDGEHIGTGFSTPVIDVAREHYRRIVMQNPEATFDAKSVRAASVADIEAAVEALRNADPSRPLADNLGLDYTNRVLTNPEVVPGSMIVPGPTPEA